MVSTGKRESRNEYAAPLEMLKQLSSAAAITALRSSQKLRARKLGSTIKGSRRESAGSFGGGAVYGLEHSEF